GDREPIFKLARGEPEVAGGGDHGRPARANVDNGCDRRYRTPLELGEHAFHARLVVYSLLCRRKILEQGNVRPRRKGATAGTGDDDGFHGPAKPDFAADVA